MNDLTAGYPAVFLYLFVERRWSKIALSPVVGKDNPEMDSSLPEVATHYFGMSSRLSRLNFHIPFHPCDSTVLTV